MRRPIPPAGARREPSQVIRRSPARPAPSPFARSTPLPPAGARPGPPPGPPPRPVAPATRRTRGKRRWLRFVSLTLVAGALLAVGGILGGAVWFDSAMHREQALADYPERPAGGRGTNWLLVGSDSREGLTPEQQRALATGGDVGSSRTDAILLVHLPELWSSTPATVVSIPRDSYVPIPGHGKDKINASFAIGGAPLLTQTVEQSTGLRLDHYAEIGFSGFAGLVDALGGVTMCPPRPTQDPLSGIDLPAGCQQLDGRSALGYVRTRATPRADLDRMVNQRQFMSALLRRVSSPAVWLNPLRWYSVPRAAVDAVTVDRGGHVWDLARLGWALQGSPTAITVPIGELTTSDAGSVVVWNHEAAGKLFDALASDAPIPPAVLEGQQ